MMTNGRWSIGFIGGGNMARAIAGGLVRSGFAPGAIRVGEPAAACRTLMRRAVPGAAIEAANDEVARHSDALVLAVKPQILAEVCRPLAAVIQQRRPLVLSIAAGPTMADIDTWLGGGLRIVRVMPNQPALVDRGISALIANERTDEKGRALAETIMSAVGEIVWLTDEALMDAVTAVSGSGPAYFYLLMDMLIEAGVSLGLERPIAEKLAVATAGGAAALAAEERRPMAELIRRVCSPGGTTTAAFERLEAANVRDIFASAIESARDRARALAAEAQDAGPDTAIRRPG